MTLIKYPILLKVNIPRLYYSTNATLESTIQLRKQLYISPLPLHDQPPTKPSPTGNAMGQLDSLEILKLLSGNDASNSISIHNPLFSVLLNKCLSDAVGNDKLRTVQSIESFYRIFEKYKHKTANSDGLYYYDLNRLCQYFIACKQLGKSQKLLDFLFKNKLGEGIHNDQFLVNYLNVRSGSDIRLWTLKKYKILDYMIISQLTSDHAKIKYMSVPIINSLGYMKNIPSLEQFLKSIWAVTLHDNNGQGGEEKGGDNEPNMPHPVQLNRNDLLYPNEDLLLSIMLSYYYNSRTMVKSFQILDLFLKKYPDIVLTSKFWYNLISECLSLTGAKGRKSKNSAAGDTNIIQIWNAMKLWYSDKDIPFNNEVLRKMYTNFKSNNNLYYIKDVYERCIGPYSIANCKLIPRQCKDTVLMYQKHIIRKYIDKRKFNRSQEFIERWAISLENKMHLLQFHQVRTNIRKKRKHKDEEEEDGIFGSLW